MEQPENTQLAQLNIAEALDDMNSQRLVDFVSAIDRVNTVASRSPGFIWRWDENPEDHIDTRKVKDPRQIINMSVWETAEALEHFVWNTIHKKVYQKKAKWFDVPKQAHFVMWWIESGHKPTLDEALNRLELLRKNGPSEEAFGWESLPNIQLWKSQRCA